MLAYYETASNGKFIPQKFLATPLDTSNNQMTYNSQTSSGRFVCRVDSGAVSLGMTKSQIFYNAQQASSLATSQHIRYDVMVVYRC